MSVGLEFILFEHSVTLFLLPGLLECQPDENVLTFFYLILITSSA